jgi:hypothetical protein
LPQLARRLRPGALLAFEASPDSVEQLASLCRIALNPEWCKTGRDYSKLGRFVVTRMAAAGKEPSASGPIPGIAAPQPDWNSSAPEETGLRFGDNEPVEPAPSGPHVGHDAGGDWTMGDGDDWLMGAG